MDPNPSFPHPVLVAADEELTAGIIEGTLREAGYPVVRASDGSQVAPLLDRHAPRVLVIDVHTARRTGLEVLRLLANRPGRERFRVLAVTAQGRATAERDARVAGADEFLVRPFSPQDLVHCVDRLYSSAVSEAA